MAKDGRVDHAALRRELVSKEDFLNAMREAGCDEVDHIRRATLDVNGRIVIELQRNEMLAGSAAGLDSRIGISAGEGGQ